MTKKSQFPLLAEFRLSILAGLAVLALTLFACSGDNDDDTDTPSTPSSSSDTPSSSSNVPSTRISPDDIDFDEITFWAGSCNGSNCYRAAFIVQWNDTLNPDGFIWGYKWDSTETKYGIDMIKAVAKKDSRFYALLYDTPSLDPSTGDSLGVAVAGFGYDLFGYYPNNENGFKLVLNTDTANGSPSSDIILLPNSNGLFWADTIAPFDTVYKSFDYYRSKDSTDHWQSGWFTKGYWSYWVTDTIGTEWASSYVGASTRELKNGSVDAWFFVVDFNPTGCIYDDDCDGREIFGELNTVEESEEP